MEQYAVLEKATIAKDTRQLFSVYAPDFEAHMFNGEVWSFKKSTAYSAAGFDQVKENISLSDTILSLTDCGAGSLKVTVLQQWSRRQMSHGALRLYQTTTVQDETWVLIERRVEAEAGGQRATRSVAGGFETSGPYEAI